MIDGVIYMLNLDYVGGLGFFVVGMQIGIYVDGVKVGSYVGISFLMVLNWEMLSFKFDGNGVSCKIVIVLEGGDIIVSGIMVIQCSVMIDDIYVIEILLVGVVVVYGLVGMGIVLFKVSVVLIDFFGSECLSFVVFGLLVDVMLDDGVYSVVGGVLVDLVGWDLVYLSVKVLVGFVGEFSLMVQVISVEISNGVSVSVSQVVKVCVLVGIVVVMFVGVNFFIVMIIVVQMWQQQVGSQVVVVVFFVVQGVLVGDCGQLGSVGDLVFLLKMVVEVVQVESDCVWVMSDVWLKELEECVKV